MAPGSATDPRVEPNVTQILTLHDPETARGHYLSGVWQSDTLYGLLRRHAELRGAALAVRDLLHRLSWKALQEWVDVLADELDRAGLRAGDRVSVWMPSRVEAVVVFLACSRNGYVCNPSLHQNYTLDEVVGLLERIGCAAFFTQAGYGADAARHDVLARVTALPSLRRAWCVAPPEPGAPQVPPAHAFPARPRERERSRWGRAPHTNPDKVVYLAFTSGTTGLPKAVMHSDNTLLANGRAMVADWGHDESTVLLSLSPLSHHIGTVAIEQCLVSGCELVLHDPAAGLSRLDWIVESGATYVMGVPTHAIDLLDDMDRRGMKHLGRVRIFYMAGAPIPEEAARRFLKLGIQPQNVYGMTESGSHQYTRPADGVKVVTETCGPACLGYEVRLWSQQDPDLEAQPGEVGEIAGRGGVLMLGYFGDQDATERSFNAHGWFMSGDLGQLDAAGNLRIVGRKKDLIIRGGHNIHPARIEDLAYRHAAVNKAAAFGVADERLGEKVCLALVCAGEPPSAQEMLAHLDAQGLSKFDMPEYYLVLPAFPLTASGKILKRELAAWARAGSVVPQPVRFVAGGTR
jgi:acyl-CoA synthetase